MGDQPLTPAILLCLAEVIVIKNTVFIDRWNKVQLAICSKEGFINCESIKLKSQEGRGYLIGGYKLLRPLRTSEDITSKNPFPIMVF